MELPQNTQKLSRDLKQHFLIYPADRAGHESPTLSTLFLLINKRSSFNKRILGNFRLNTT